MGPTAAESRLSCPQCDDTLAPVKARARTGYLLALDQCTRCGGLWCDKWELFPIASQEVDRLDPVDRGALQRPTPRPPARTCPRCGIALRQFTDRLLPADVLIDRCPLCEGMWLNAGSLRRFDAHRRAGRPPKPMPKELIGVLGARCREPAKWSTVERLSDAVDAPAPREDDGGLRDALWQGAAWIALRWLLRLLLRV